MSSVRQIKVVGVNNIRSYPIMNVNKIGLNSSVQLGTAVAPANATNKGLVWTLVGVGSISQTGLFTSGGVGGVAVIQAISAENPKIKSGAYVINVVIPVTGFELSVGSRVTKIHRRFTGQTTSMLVPVFTPSNATNKNIKYTSSNPKVATVNSAGLVAAGSTLGTAIITAVADDKTFGVKKATATFTIVY